MSRKYHWTPVGAALLTLAILLYRVYLCTFVPYETTDLYRHLGYASHLPDLGTSLYRTVANDFLPEAWAESWGGLGYVYPPAALVFFSLFSSFGWGMFWVKFTLTLMEFYVACAFWRRLSPWATPLLLAAPVAVWYSSHEGQYDSLQMFLIALSLLSLEKGGWKRAGFFWSLAAQVKVFAVLMVPFFLVAIFQKAAGEDSRGWRFRLKNFSLGTALGILPFLIFYIRVPETLVMPLRSQSIAFNPLGWNPFDPVLFNYTPYWTLVWIAIATYGLLFAVLAFMGRHRREAWQATPLLFFLLLLKSMKWAVYWYMLIVPAFLLRMTRWPRWAWVFVLLYALGCAHSIAMLKWNFAYDLKNGETYGYYQNCVWTCDYSQVNPRN